MIKHFLLCIAILAGSLLGFSISSVNAAPSANVFSSIAEINSGHIYKVHYPRRRSCTYWRDRCGYYHKYSDYDWCLRDRGCSRYPRQRSRPNSSPSRYRCRSIHYRCVRNWGRDNSDYFGCMRYHRCLLRRY